MSAPCCGRARRVAAWLLAWSLAAAPVAAAPRESEAALAALLRAEEDLSETADLARLSNLRAQESAALALSRASAALALALEAANAARPGRASSPSATASAGRLEGDPDAETSEAVERSRVARAQRLVMASLAHAEAREGLARLLAEEGGLEARSVAHRTRIDALRDALAALRATAPPAGEMDGTWRLVLAPLQETLTLHLSQSGPFVGGPFESSSGVSGTITGQVVGGHVRLERHEPSRGKMADILGMLTSTGAIEGTWQSTILGSGKPDAGTFTGTRQAP